MTDSPESWAERRDGIIPHGAAEPHRTMRRARLRSGRWRTARRAVAAVNGAPRTWRQSLRAAIVAAGPEAFASHESALALYGLESISDGLGRIELSAPLLRQIRMDGVVAHRSGTLVEGDVVRRWEFACSSPVRTVIDMSGRLNVTVLGRLVDEMVRRRLLRVGELRERLAELRPAPGRSVVTLRAIVAARPDGFDPGESDLESRVMRVILRHGFPRPEPQRWIRTSDRRLRPDWAYVEPMIFLEGDGFGFHRFASDLDRDSRRRNALVLVGWRPLTFTWRMTDGEIVATLDGVYDRATSQWRPIPRR